MDEAEQQRVFDEWMGAHQGLLFKIVRAYAFTSHDQEDLFQEIVLRVWDSIPGFRRQSAVTTWLYRVALYAAMAWSRKETRQRGPRRDLNGVEQTLTRVPEAEDPRLERLYAEIARLDEVDRSLTLMLLDGLGYRAMATALGISESNVGVKINRIKKHLATRLG